MASNGKAPCCREGSLWAVCRLADLINLSPMVQRTPLASCQRVPPTECLESEGRVLTLEPAFLKKETACDISDRVEDVYSPLWSTSWPRKMNLGLKLRESELFQFLMSQP